MSGRFPSSSDGPVSKRWADQRTRDHFPTCPNCGDLCGLLAVKCAGCGTTLKATALDLATARKVGSQAMQAARTGEAESTTRERAG